MMFLTTATSDAVSETVTEAISGALESEGGLTLSEFMYKGWLGLLAENGQIPLVLWIAAIVFCALLGYFLGSLNFAVVISRLKFHDDIRKHGSGNAGATNMTRTYGKAAGVATLLGDIMKAILSVILARLLCGETIAYLTGMCCAFGHAFPCYYRFKGGKCVAVTAAIALVMEPFAFLTIFAIFALVVFVTKYVSLGSIAAAFFYPLILHKLIMNRGYGHLSILFVTVICLLVIWLHRENIKRLLDGKENKFSFGKSQKQKNSDEK